MSATFRARWDADGHIRRTRGEVARTITRLRRAYRTARRRTLERLERDQ